MVAIPPIYTRERWTPRPKCRPPRRKTPTMGCRGRGGLRSGHNGARPRVELARKPLNMRVNPLDTHVNLSTCAWEALPTREVSGPRASQRGPGARRGVQAASMPRRTALPDTQCPHLAMATRSPTHQARGGIHAHDETIPFNADFPVPASRRVTTKSTRCVLKPRHSARPVARGQQGGHHRNSASS